MRATAALSPLDTGAVTLAARHPQRGERGRVEASTATSSTAPSTAPATAST